MNDGTPTDPAELRTLAVELARAGGDLALTGRRARTVAVAATKSSHTDLVTEFDRAAEKLMVDELHGRRPADAVVGVEGAARGGGSGYEWFIDPIDGTTNYVYGLPTWSTSVGVTLDGAPVAGAVYLPVPGQLYAAHRGGGATLDDAPIRCSDCVDLALALVATGFGYDESVRRAQADRVAAIIGEFRDIRRFGSAAIDLCHVASGRVDVYFEEHLNPWDAVAGLVNAEEAGCITSDLGGGPVRPESLVAAAPGVHASFIDLLGRARS